MAVLSKDGTRFGTGSSREWIKEASLKQSSQLLKRVLERSPTATGRTRRLVGSVIHLGQYLIVMEQIGGEWKIVQHFSLNAGETPAVNAAPSATPTLPDQLSVEKWFVGEWICEGEQHPSPKAVAVQFTDKFTFKMALDGSWLTYHIDQTKGPLQGKRTLVGWGTWDANAKVHVRRDMNIGGSRVDVTALGWDGDKLVFTGYMITNDGKLPVQQTFTKEGDAAYDSALVVTGAEGKPMEGEEESCRKVGKAIQWRRSQHSGLGKTERRLENCRVSGDTSCPSERVRHDIPAGD